MIQKQHYMILIVIGILFSNLMAYKAKSPLLNDVKIAVDSAKRGESVFIPSGTATWTSPLNITKEIILKGAGINKTIIINAIETNYEGAIHIEVAANTKSITRVTELTFTSDKKNTSQYHILVANEQEFRIDHCKFNNGLKYLSHDVTVRGYSTYGVIDHCLFDTCATEAILVTASNQTWEEDPTLGSYKATFVEDCIFMNSPGGHAITSVFGAKTVFRYNKIYEKDIDVHGHCFNKGWSSARHYEIYENDIYSLGKSYWMGFYIRGGTGVIFNNRLHKTGKEGGFHAEIALTEYSVTTNCPNGGCQDKYPIEDQVGRGKNQTSEPLYIWNNQMDENIDEVNDRKVTVLVREAQESSQCGTKSTTGYIKNVPHDGQSNPDFYDDGTKPPNYKPYRYPHPITEIKMLDENTPFSPDSIKIK